MNNGLCTVLALGTITFAVTVTEHVSLGSSELMTVIVPVYSPSSLVIVHSTSITSQLGSRTSVPLSGMNFQVPQVGTLVVSTSQFKNDTGSPQLQTFI
jgi:hypothetical protein